MVGRPRRGNERALQRVARPLRSARFRAAALTLPLVACIGVTFLAPLGVMLARSFHEPVVADALPATLAILQTWDGTKVPTEDAFRTLGSELRTLAENRALGGVAARINRLETGMRSAIVRTARSLRKAEPVSWRDAMTAAAPVWGETRAWRALRRAGERYTVQHYLNALDLERVRFTWNRTRRCGCSSGIRGVRWCRGGRRDGARCPRPCASGRPASNA